MSKTSPVRILKFVGETKLRLTFDKNNSKTGKWMRKQITELGPAFIKLGQFLSTRSDLLEKSIASELQMLQDDVTPVQFAELVPIMNQSLAKDYGDVFSWVDTTAIASASIGQVHLAKIIGSEKFVAIKIHKPNISEKIKNDIESIKQLLYILNLIGNPRSAEFESILLEYEKFLLTELDFRKEMRHMIRFKQLLAGLPVKIPDVSEKYSSEKLLVMEYVESVKINNIAAIRGMNINTVDVATNLVNIFLHQIIENGYVHSDPHPGNIGIRRDGTIVLYDFGNVVKFTPNFKKKINQLMISLYQKDVEEFVDLLIQLEILYVADDIEIIEIKAFFGYFFKYLETLDLSSLKVSVIQNDLQGKFQTTIKVNQDFISLFRVFSLLDGTYSLLDPNFSYIKAIGPFTDDMMSNPEFFDYRAKKDIEKLRTYPRLLQSADSNILRLQQKTKAMNKDFQNLKMIVGAFVLFDNYEHAIPFLTLSIPLYIWNNLQSQSQKQSGAVAPPADPSRDS